MFSFSSEMDEKIWWLWMTMNVQIINFQGKAMLDIKIISKFRIIRLSAWFHVYVNYTFIRIKLAWMQQRSQGFWGELTSSDLGCSPHTRQSPGLLLQHVRLWGSQGGFLKTCFRCQVNILLHGVRFHWETEGNSKKMDFLGKCNCPVM